MKIENLNINNVNYDIDLDTLKNNIEFTFTGRKFRVQGSDNETHDLTFNQIFEAIAKRDDIPIGEGIQAYLKLKDYGYNKDDANDKGSRLIATALHKLGVGRGKRKEIAHELTHTTKVIDVLHFLRRGNVISENDAPSFFNHKLLNKKTRQEINDEISNIPIVQRLKSQNKELTMETARELVGEVIKRTSITPEIKFSKQLTLEKKYVHDFIKNYLKPFLDGTFIEETEDKNRPTVITQLLDQFKKEFPKSDIEKEELEKMALEEYIYILAELTIYETSRSDEGLFEFVQVLKPALDIDFRDMHLTNPDIIKKSRAAFVRVKEDKEANLFQ